MDVTSWNSGSPTDHDKAFFFFFASNVFKTGRSLRNIEPKKRRGEKKNNKRKQQVYSLHLRRITLPFENLRALVKLLTNVELSSTCKNRTPVSVYGFFLMVIFLFATTRISQLSCRSETMTRTRKFQKKKTQIFTQGSTLDGCVPSFTMYGDWL